MSGEQYRSYPESLTMRQVSVDARGKDNRAEQFQVVTTILDASIDGGQIGSLYERRWDGEVDIRSTDQIDHENGRAALQDAGDGSARRDLDSLAGVQPAPHGHGGGRSRERLGASRSISFKGAKQTLTAFAPKLDGGAAGRSRVGWLMRC